METMIWIWGAVIAIGLIVEFSSMDLVSIWFSIAAIASLILAVFNVQEWIQIIVFLVLSAILILSTRKIVNKWQKERVATNADALIGKETRLLSEITETEKGSLIINDVVWTAVCAEPVMAGKFVRINAIEGNKLVVSEIKERN